MYQRKVSPNLDLKEKDALKELKQNKDITIKRADKGGGVTVLDTTEYINKVNDMLSDEQTYSKVVIDDTDMVKLKSDEIFKELLTMNFITNKQYKNLTNFKPSCPIFYGLPKIHKANIPLRPIVSQINGPTNKISKFVSELLFVAEHEIPELLLDTTSFLNLIQKHNKTTSNTLLVTMDVTSLYTNIPHEEGVDWVTQFYVETLPSWHKYSRNIKPVPGDLLKRMMYFILKNCTFEFNAQLFKQQYGTTMGANFSVRFANIYMHKFYKTFLAQYIGPIPELYSRFIDDIFVLWELEEKCWEKFFLAINSYHDSIKFTFEISKSEIHFLDTTICIKNNTLRSNLYTKPTDKKQYLHYKSNHPLHVKKALPFSQSLRLRRIIDDDDNLRLELKNLKNNFVNRGYPPSFVDEATTKIWNVNRDISLVHKTETVRQIDFERFIKGGLFLPLIITFSNSLTLRPNINNLVKNWWQRDILENEMLTCFSGSHPKIIFKRGTTLSNLLVKAKITPLPSNDLVVDINNSFNTDTFVRRCNTPRCLCCNYIKYTNSFTSSYTKKTFYIDSEMSCNSKNVIYLIQCSKCKAQYVGETKRRLKDRLNNHTSCIRTKANTCISLHFNDIQHKLTDLKIIPIEEVEVDDKSVRLHRERYWINILKTAYPKGINYFPLNKLK